MLERHVVRPVHQRVDARGVDAGPRRAARARDVVGTDDRDLVLPPGRMQDPVLVGDLPVAHQVERPADRHGVGNRDRELRRSREHVAGELEVVGGEVAPAVRDRLRQRVLGDGPEADGAGAVERVRRDRDDGAVRGDERAAVGVEDGLLLLRRADGDLDHELGAAVDHGHVRRAHRDAVDDSAGVDGRDRRVAGEEERAGGHVHVVDVDRDLLEAGRRHERDRVREDVETGEELRLVELARAADDDRCRADDGAAGDDERREALLCADDRPRCRTTRATAGVGRAERSRGAGSTTPA